MSIDYKAFNEMIKRAGVKPYLVETAMNFVKEYEAAREQPATVEAKVGDSIPAGSTITHLTEGGVAYKPPTQQAVGVTDKLRKRLVKPESDRSPFAYFNKGVEECIAIIERDVSIRKAETQNHQQVGGTPKADSGSTSRIQYGLAPPEDYLQEKPPIRESVAPEPVGIADLIDGNMMTAAVTAALTKVGRPSDVRRTDDAERKFMVSALLAAVPHLCQPKRESDTRWHEMKAAPKDGSRVLLKYSVGGTDMRVSPPLPYETYHLALARWSEQHKCWDGCCGTPEGWLSEQELVTGQLDEQGRRGTDA